jgi:hypothetical protein
MITSLHRHKFPRTTGPVLPVSLACCLLLLPVTGCTLNPIQPDQPPTTPSQTDSSITGEKTAGKDAGLITLVAGMQAGEHIDFHGKTVESGQAFSAASGRLCKYITLRNMDAPDNTYSRLACQDGSNWFFATDIFSSKVWSD